MVSRQWAAVARASDRDLGITLLEVIIAAGLMTLVIGNSLVLSSDVEKHLSNNVIRLTVDDTCNRVVNRVSEQLRQVYPDSVNPTVLDDSAALTFRKVTGYSGGTVQLGPEHGFEFQPAPGESDNGQDDNGDGRIDEGVLVYTEDGTSIVIAENVLGLGFTSANGGISFSFGVGLVDRDGNVIQNAWTRQLAFRN